MTTENKTYWFALETTVQTNYTIDAKDEEEAKARIKELRERGAVGSYGILSHNFGNIKCGECGTPPDPIYDWGLSEEGSCELGETVSELNQVNDAIYGGKNDVA